MGSVESPANAEEARLREDATEHLLPAVYARLRMLAGNARQDFFALDTFNTTALVNEAWLRLQGNLDIDRRRYFALSATVMRRVLVDALRRRTADKRSAVAEVPLDEQQLAVSATDDLLALDAALERLAARSPRLEEVVECRFFAGYSQEETANILGVTERTVRRDWNKARAFLKRMMDEDPPLGSD